MREHPCHGEWRGQAALLGLHSSACAPPLATPLHPTPAGTPMHRCHTMRSSTSAPPRLPLQQLLRRQRPAECQLLAHRAADEVALRELEHQARLQPGKGEGAQGSSGQ